jgi:hypothetical protein
MKMQLTRSYAVLEGLSMSRNGIGVRKVRYNSATMGLNNA